MTLLCSSTKRPLKNSNPWCKGTKFSVLEKNATVKGSINKIDRLSESSVLRPFLAFGKLAFNCTV